MESNINLSKNISGLLISGTIIVCGTLIFCTNLDFSINSLIYAIKFFIPSCLVMGTLGYLMGKILDQNKQKIKSN